MMDLANKFIYLNTSLGNVLAIPPLDHDVKFSIVTWIENVNTRPYHVLFSFFLFFLNLETSLNNSCTQRLHLL